MKAAVELHERDFKIVRTACTTGADAKYNIGVGRTVQCAITALLRQVKIETAETTVVKGRPDYAAIFKDVSNNGVEKC